MTALTVCSTAFENLGRIQAKALGFPDLRIAVVPHPFGLNPRAQVRELAERCVLDIVRQVTHSVGSGATHEAVDERAGLIEVMDDIDAVNALFRERRWTDGLPIVPPTAERVERMLGFTSMDRNELISRIAPGFGGATVERVAINAVMAGCLPEYLPVLLAAADAIAAPEFNLQGMQVTTNPATVWLIVNGPAIKRLALNAGINCLGQGNWGNATLGRALHLMLHNIGGAHPGGMDRATHGQPGKYIFCCPENEDHSPWDPLHVDRGMRRDQSAVTVVAAEGTLNMNTHSKNADEVLRVIAESLPRPPSNDYTLGGSPWVILSPEHANVLHAAGLSKDDVRSRLWEESKMRAGRMSAIDLQRTQIARRAELGGIDANTMLPICPRKQDLGILVSGGPGTHSVYVPSYGDTTEAITREIRF